MVKLRTAVCLLAVTLVTGACAPKAITLQPGKTEWGEARDGGADAWSLWVAEAVDRRPGASANKVGLLYPRLQREPQTVNMEPAPASYMEEELRRFLLHRGLEASEARRARLHLRVEVTDFSLKEKPGSVMDEITVRVEYTVRFVTPLGAELGSLRLEGSSIIQTPVSARRKAEEGFRNALADTFKSLLASDVFNRLLVQVR